VRKGLAWVVAAAIAVPLAGLILTRGNGDERRPGALVTAAVARVDLKSEVTATGSLRPLVRVDVSSQLSGQIAEVFVDFNDTVARDQPIARLDQVPYEARVREAAAALESARTSADIRRAMIGRAAGTLASVEARRPVLEARIARSQAGYDQTKRELDRKERLYSARTVSMGDLDSARAASDGAAATLTEAQAELAAHKAEVAEAQAALRVAEAELANAVAAVEQQAALLEQAQFELARTTIRAPIGGVVITRSVDRGQTVAASLEAPTLFTLAQDLQKMTVHAKVDEASIGTVRIGQRATFTVDAYPDRSFAGTVVQIRQAPEVTQSVVTYPVLIEVDNPDRALLPGMTASVQIVVAEARDALAVPSAALRFRPSGAAPDGHETEVWRLDGKETPVPVPVTLTGLADESWTGIAAGPLKENDRVLVGAGPAGEDPASFGIRFGL
jgi:HlyD family secretion protein